MIEMPLSQAGRAEWPTPLRKTRKRRDSSRLKSYHNTSRPSPRNSPPAASPPPPEYLTAASLNLLPNSPTQSLDLQYLDFFDLQSPPPDQQPSPVTRHDVQHQSAWPSSSAPYTFTSSQRDVSPTLPGDLASSPMNNVSFPDPSNGLNRSWTNETFMTNSSGTDMENLSMSDMRFGSLESFNSFDSMLLGSPDTGASSISEGYGFPGMDNTFGLPESNLDGFDLPDGFRQATGQTLDPLDIGAVASSMALDEFQFDEPNFVLQGSWIARDVYSTQGGQWSSTTLTQPQMDTIPRPYHASNASHIPWNSQQAQISPFQADAHSGIRTFEPVRGPTYNIHRAGEDFLQNRHQVFGPEVFTPTDDNISDGWTVPSYANSYAASHKSPQSQGSLASRGVSPAHIEAEYHSHVFSANSELPKPKTSKGRTRNLTAQEKKSAREVREAKACWACHISKTKCSPCSSGNPCEQCARLVGKRRFCKFTCFNAPLDLIVQIPSTCFYDPLNVEAIVRNNTTSWGTRNILVRLLWGYSKPLEAEMVLLTLRSASSDLGYHHQAIANGSARPKFVRKVSPPLGIELAAMAEMEIAYSQYIEDIVKHDSASYAFMAYDQEESMLPERLLDTVCSYYSSTWDGSKENDLLRRVIEIHVVRTMIERSLIIDSDSISRIQGYTQHIYPPRTSPRCAELQIKLALFNIQLERIVSVLKDWGNLMWTIHNVTDGDKKWAQGFCVFIILTLVIDKTLSTAYRFSEAQIDNYGANATAKRKHFLKFKNMLETDLFERCKEIFHWKFKTRKAGKEALNPIRDDMEAFKGRPVDDGMTKLVRDLRSIAKEFEPEIRDDRTIKHPAGMPEQEIPYIDGGRLACIFLHDFLERT